jgi:multimeric flavodoxin WrbA
MKVVAFNCSPNMDEGNTALIMNPFLEGLKDEGAEVELFYTKKLKINPCSADFHCWIKSSGRCYHDDDMNGIYPKLSQAEIWVFGTPIFCSGMSGPMKNLIDRGLPLFQPYFEVRDGHTFHPVSQEDHDAKVVLIASCAFWEMENFDPLLVYMKHYCRNASREFAGALLRPHAPSLMNLKKVGRNVGDIFQSARDAGRQLIREKKMSPETLQNISRELVSLERYILVANRGFKTMINKNADEIALV